MKKVSVIPIMLASLVLCPSPPHGKTPGDPPRRNAPTADFTQAELMLRLLQSPYGQAPSELIESVLNAHGTSLVIRQQNISRSVTKDQYKLLLLSLDREQPPDVTPVDASERARRGVEGLRKDVWAALRWGRTNTPVLAERLGQIKRLKLYRSSTALAEGYLPEAVRLSPRLYVVMGGRAGAATLEGGDIYFDVLVTSHRAATGTLKYPAPSQITEYFAHEVHHLGLSKILNRTRDGLRLSRQEERAFAFLTALVMEGGASYLVNGHRSLEVLRRDPQFTENLGKGGELLALSGRVLRSVLENNLDGDAYDKAVAPFLGSGWHSAGAIMFAAIDRAEGLKGVMRVLRDPRKLLVAYNKATAKLKSGSQRRQFDRDLAEKVSAMGERARG
jgi:hypothetical protein